MITESHTVSICSAAIITHSWGETGGTPAARGASPPKPGNSVPFLIHSAHSAAHTGMHAATGGCGFFFLDVADQAFSSDQQACDA